MPPKRQKSIGEEGGKVSSKKRGSRVSSAAVREAKAAAAVPNYVQIINDKLEFLNAISLSDAPTCILLYTSGDEANCNIHQISSSKTLHGQYMAAAASINGSAGNCVARKVRFYLLDVFENKTKEISPGSSEENKGNIENNKDGENVDVRGGLSTTSLFQFVVSLMKDPLSVVQPKIKLVSSSADKKSKSKKITASTSASPPADASAAEDPSASSINAAERIREAPSLPLFVTFWNNRYLDCFSGSNISGMFNSNGSHSSVSSGSSISSGGTGPGGGTGNFNTSSLVNCNNKLLLLCRHAIQKKFIAEEMVRIEKERAEKEAAEREKAEREAAEAATGLSVEA